MKFTVSQSDLSSAMAFVTSAVESKSTMPILQNVLIVADEGKLTITGTNLEIEKSVTIESAVGESGSITVPARKLLDFAKNADSSKDISLELKGAEATIKSGRSRWKLSTLPAKDFPESNSMGDNPQSINVDIAELSRGISKVLPSMAQQDVRYYLNGMLFDVSESGLTIVATDGHRMSMYTVDADSHFEKQSIVPRTAVSDISKMISKGFDGTIEVTSNYLKVETSSMMLKTKLIDGKYPDYKRVIPSKCCVSAEMSTVDLVNAVKRAMPLANQTYKGIKLSFDTDSLRITASNQQQEEAFEEIPCNIDGDNMDIGFNGIYVQDAISAIESDSTIIQLSDGSSSARIDEGKFTAVLMPMRL